MVALLLFTGHGGADKIHADEGNREEDESAQDKPDSDGIGREGAADEIVDGGPGREDDPGPKREMGAGAPLEIEAGHLGNEIIKEAKTERGEPESEDAVDITRHRAIPA